MTHLQREKTDVISAMGMVGIMLLPTDILQRKKRGAKMSNSSVKKQSYNVPLWVKPNLSIKEASAYSRIPTSKLYEITERQDCSFVLWIGSRRMIKRKAFEQYIANQYSI